MGILSPNRSISHLACGRHARRLGSHSQLPRPQRDSNNIHIGLRRPRSAYHHGPVGGFSRTGRLEESPSKCHPLLLGSRAHRHPRRHVLNRKPSGLVSTTPPPISQTYTISRTRHDFHLPLFSQSITTFITNCGESRHARTTK